jgi:Aspartyl/Asparaginyl beta-hydroxylase
MVSTTLSLLLFTSSISTTRSFSTNTKALPLTDRQLQFWEDVEVGLKDIESYWLKQRGQNIDRIWQFSRRYECMSSSLISSLIVSDSSCWYGSAKNEVAPPVPVAYGHEPSEEHVHGLTAKPFWEAKEEPLYFPWAAELEAKSSIIIGEFAKNSMQFSSDSVWQNQVMGNGWSAIRLQRLGVWNSENCMQFPETVELLRSLQIPLAVRGVCFARQAPGSGVQPHSDGRNFILTSHLGLEIPEGCWIEVGGHRRGWEAGKLTILDTSFSHSTGNPSDKDRNVLIIDFWHPELSEAERAALEFVYDLRNRFESGMVPFRKPKSATEEEGGLSMWFSKLTGGQ